MLNYNVNYIEPFNRRNRNFQLGKVEYLWQRVISTAGGPQSGSIIFGTGSITYVPYAPTTLFVSGTYSSELLGTGSALGQPIAISVTGSGQWPTTGSNVLYINVGGNLGFNQSTSSIFSAAAGNMNLSSGSRISSSFTPIGNQEFSINFGVNHIKGNIYNPLVNLKVENASPSTTTGNVNGHTASFNMVKDVNVPLYSFSQVTGSTNRNFQYDYNFGITSSLTASIQSNATGSTTMSISIPEAGVSTSSLYVNATSAGTKIITSSFAATTDSTYNVTASVVFNKGNVSNSDINWKVSSTSETEDLEGNQTNINGVSSSFQLKKDIAVMVSYPEVTSSLSGSYPNNYSFNQTASITSNVNNTTGSVTMSIIVPESGINIEQRFFNETTSTATLTASFAAYGQAPFNVTASIINNKGNVSNSNINWKVTGSRGGYQNYSSASFKIDKNINQSIINVANAYQATGSTFKNDYAFNITSSLSGSLQSSWINSCSESVYSTRFRLQIPELSFDTSLYEEQSLITASFAAITSIDNYNITASAEQFTSSIKALTVTAVGGGATNSIGEIKTINVINLEGFRVTLNQVGIGAETPNSGGYTIASVYTSSIANPGSARPIILEASGGLRTYTSVQYMNAFTPNGEFFPNPNGSLARNYVDDPLGNDGQANYISGSVQIVYYGEPTMTISGGRTSYDRILNTTTHVLTENGAYAEFQYEPVATFSNYITAETLTIGGGGRGGMVVKPKDDTVSPSLGFQSGGGGAGGYILADQWFDKSKTYNVVVGEGADYWINCISGSPVPQIQPIVFAASGSDSYIVDNTTQTTIQFSKGGGNGAPNTYFELVGAYLPGDAYGRSGGAGGGAMYLNGGGGGFNPYQGGGSVGNVVSASNPSGPEYYTSNGLGSGGYVTGQNGYNMGGGGGGAFQSGSDAGDYIARYPGENQGPNPTPAGSGGIGKYDLSFTPQKIGGGGSGGNAQSSASMDWGGGNGNQTTASALTDGDAFTGGGGGGIVWTAASQSLFLSSKGGSGKVQIRYKGLPQATGGVITTGSLCDGVYTLHTFTASGTFTPTV